MLADTILHQINDIISAVQQTTLTEFFFTINNLSAVHTGNIGNAGDHTMSLLVAQATVYMMLIEQHIINRVIGIA